MTRDEAIKKIRKCLSLAKSAAGAEAAAALRQAQALMRQFEVDEEGAALAAVEERDARARFIPILAWEAALIGLVAEAFGCEVISLLGSKLVNDQYKYHRDWRLMGVGSAPEIAAYSFDVLATQVVRARRDYMAKQPARCKKATRVARGDAFAMSWVANIEGLVERHATSERHAELLIRHKAKTYPDLGKADVKNRSEGRNVKDAAFHGRMAAKDATLPSGVGGPQERRLLGVS